VNLAARFHLKHCHRENGSGVGIGRNRTNRTSVPSPENHMTLQVTCNL
jgi:hypothetical protein